MTEAKDTKNITEIADALLTGVSIFKQAGADGKVDFADLGLLLQLVPVIGPAIEGADQVVPEFADLSVAEAEALVAHIMVKLTLDNAKAVEIAKASLTFAASGFKLYKAISAPEQVVKV